MKPICVLCKTDLDNSNEQLPESNVTGSICFSCANKFKLSSSADILKEIIDTIDTPILLMQPEPRQVYTANNKALELFDKTLSQAEGCRGGQVFDCVHAFTEAGCGKDANCENCKIKNAVIETFAAGKSFKDIATDLQINKNGEISLYNLRVSTEKVGDLELLRIDQYKKKT